MTEQDWIELGKRAVACEGFRWLPGMANMRGEVCVAVNPGGKEDVAFGGCFGTIWASSEGYVPDMREPGTRGGMVALMREAWGDPGAYARRSVRPSSVVWDVVVIQYDGRRRAPGPLMDEQGRHGRETEAKALVAALEAAARKAKVQEEQ